MDWTASLGYLNFYVDNPQVRCTTRKRTLYFIFLRYFTMISLFPWHKNKDQHQITLKWEKTESQPRISHQSILL